MSTGLIIALAIIVILAVYLIISVKKFKKNLQNYDPRKESQNLVLLNDNTFYKKISGKIALVDFWAEWCQPCKIQGPIVSELADKYADNKKIAICKLDVDANKKIATKLNIKNIPTLILFKHGKEVQRFVGLKTKKILDKAIQLQLSQK